MTGKKKPAPRPIVDRRGQCLNPETGEVEAALGPYSRGPWKTSKKTGKDMQKGDVKPYA